MKELNQLASKLVGDGKKPKLYFVCENAKCVMITTDGEAAYKKWDADFNAKYPQGFSVDLISYPIDNMNKPAIINYTSGTTSDPKGVILPYRSISSNVQFGQDRIPNQPGWSMVSMLDAICYRRYFSSK